MSPWIIIILTLVFSAFFSGMEIAFVSSNKLRVEIEKKRESLPPKIIGWFAHRPDYFIATMLVGNNISLVIYGLQMAIILEPWIASWTNSETWVLVMQTLIATGLILFTAEFLPKMIFRLQPNRALRFFAIPLIILYVILFPVTWIAIGLSKLMLKRFFSVDDTSVQQTRVFSKVDLDHLVNQTHDDQDNPQELDQKMKLFQNALDFSKVRLRDCMIPRTEIEAVEVQTSIDTLSQRFIETGFSRILIYEEFIDHIIGYAHHSDLFRKPSYIRAMVRPVPIVPETMPANKLLSQLLADHLSIAVVVDEFGGTAGLVSTEDVLEEIFGDIEDEHDKPDLIETQVNDTKFHFSGRVEIDHLNDQYRFYLPESEEYDTLAGLILFYHKSIPTINETIEIEGFSFRILKSTTTRIELVEMTIG